MFSSQPKAEHGSKTVADFEQNLIQNKRGRTFTDEEGYRPQSNETDDSPLNAGIRLKLSIIPLVNRVP